MKMVFKGVVGDEFVDKHALSSSHAVTNKRYKVAVMNPTNDVNLCLELPLTLTASCLQLLYCYILSVWQHPLVHIPEPSLSYHVSLREPICRSRQLFI